MSVKSKLNSGQIPIPETMADGKENKILETFFIMRKQKRWDDENPIFYPSRKNPAVNSLNVGSKIIVEKELQGEIMFIGHGEINLIEYLEQDPDLFPSDLPNSRYRIPLKNFVRFYPPKMKTPEMRLILRSLPDYFWTHSIRPITKEVHDYIVQICSKEDWNQFIQDQSPLVKKSYTNLDDILSQDESASIEFKSSLRIPTGPSEEMIRIQYKIENCSDDQEKLRLQSKLKNLKDRQPSDVVHSIMKTIAAFLNTQGGTLFVGISDRKEILGIENDYKTFRDKQNWDQWSLCLKDLISEQIGAAISTQIYVEPMVYRNGKTVAVINVPAGSREIFLVKKNKEGNDEEAFYVRNSGGSSQLTMSQANEYIRDRFRK